MPHPDPDNKPSLHVHLRKTKAVFLATTLTLAGVPLTIPNGWLFSLNLGDWSWLHVLPFGELGGTPFGAGLLDALFEYSFRKDQEAATTHQLRQIIYDEVSAMRDAMIKGFRFNIDDMERIATPKLLNESAVNSSSTRSDDVAFGREVYGDIEYQAVMAEKRWYDARADATLGIPKAKSIAPNPFFDLLVRRRYTVVPKHRSRRSAVVSDRQRYGQMVAKRGEMSARLRRPASGLEVTDPAVFALEQFTINGKAVPFTRQADDAPQVCIVDLGEQVVRDEKPVAVLLAFRTLVPRDGHVVHTDIDRPVEGSEVELTYDAAAVRRVRLMGFVSRGGGGRIITESEIPVARYRYDGWLFPRAGLMFTWALTDEGSITAPQTAAEAFHPKAPKRSVPTACTNLAHKGDEYAVPEIRRDVRHRQAAQRATCLVRFNQILQHLSSHPWWSPPVMTGSDLGEIDLVL